jgi:hypothetical protein
VATASWQKSLIAVAFATFALLLIPAVAMQFSPDVSWGPGDFLAAGILLFGAGAICVLGFRHVKRFSRRIALIGVVGFGLVLVWAELAVGLFD